MSPEQIDALPIDGRSDVFALGLMAWELLAGRRPFASESPRAQLEQVCTAPTPALPEHVRAGLPLVFEQLINWMLAKQAADRPRANEVVSLLESLIRSAPASRAASALPRPITPPITRPPPPPATPAPEASLRTVAIVESARHRPPIANPRMIGLGAAALVAVIGLALVARWAIKDTSDDEEVVVHPVAASASGPAASKPDVPMWTEPVESLNLDFGPSSRPPLRSRYVVQLSSHRHVDAARYLLDRAQRAGFEGALIQKTPVISVVLEGGATERDAEAVAAEASVLTPGSKPLTRDFELWCDAGRTRDNVHICRPYVLWARTHSAPEAAIRIAAKLDAAGIPARVVKHDGEFKVLAGLYENSEAAAGDEQRILRVVGGEGAQVWRPMRECRAVRPARGYDICED